jgi:CDP-2,3-bis-(O-geranylgeranyl)-sn-glycerol synthase
MGMLEIIGEGIYLMLPAYFANMSAVVVGRGGKPMDRGKEWRGRPIFGKGKTWRGFIGGSLIGWIVGIIMVAIYSPYGNGPSALLPPFTLSLGALLGDLGGSFIKRRIGIERGEPAPVLDQLDFVAGSLLFTLILCTDWFLEEVNPPILAVIIVLTPPLHILANYLAYKLGLKPGSLRI